MSIKLFSIINLFLLFSSCSNQFKEPKDIPIIGSQKDSITFVDIEYYPAFSSRSVLRLDSKSGTTVFKVDTSEKGYQELPPQWLAFSMNDIDTASSIKRFWDESFIKSLKDTSNSGVRDGMHVRVVYGKGNSKDSVSLGNSRPKWIDSLLLEQITYLNSIAKDSIMKDNLKEIRDYLHL